MYHVKTAAFSNKWRQLRAYSLWFFLIAFTRAGFTLPEVADKSDTTNYTLEEIICVTSRLPITTATSARSFTVLNRRALLSAPGFSISDLLAYVPGVDVRRRGSLGVQADLSIRGGTFEQTAVMMDGVKLNDPQTGHHNLDLPLALDQIERIEVLRGPGSSLYGPGAFSGAINIVTRRGHTPTLSGSASAGEHGLMETTLSASHPVGTTRQSLSISRAASRGYLADTDFSTWSGFYRGVYPLGLSEFNLSAGYLNKEFGANSFYSSAFPLEREATETRFVHAGFQTSGKAWTLAPRVYWRRHRDDFHLDRNQPNLYHNLHTTDILGGELQATLESALGQTAVGGELAAHYLTSTNLHDHRRTMGGMFIEQRLRPLGRLQSSAGAFLYHYGEFGWKAWPDLNFALMLPPRFNLHGSLSWSFRVPTFTELYYHDPANIGNPALQAERAWAYEVGAGYRSPFFRAGLSAFRRESSNLIDWVRAVPTEPWHVLNVSELKTTGLEAELLWQAGGGLLSQVSANYTRLFMDSRQTDYQSKNARLYLRHQIALELDLQLPWKLTTHWAGRYLDREDHSEVVLLDARLARPFANIEPFFSVTNLLNSEYYESGFAPMPGRWLRGGFTWNVGL